MASQALIKEFEDLLGKENVFSSEADRQSYSYDSAVLPPVVPAFALRPTTTEQLGICVKKLYDYGIPMTVRGAGTNLSGGTIPDSKESVVILTNGLNRILEINSDDLYAVVEPGVVTATFAAEVAKKNLFYPPDPGSQAVSTLAGNIAENAGGLRGLKYGVTKDYLMGLEFFDATGELVKSGSRTVKCVTGYNLAGMMLQSEGTLGIISQAVLKLVPPPQASKALMAVFDDMQKAAEAVVVERVLQQTGAVAVHVAKDAAEKFKLWEARRQALPVLARCKPTTVLEDATVPRSQIPAMMKAVNDIAKKYNVEVGTFGHAGDGNLHPTFLCDKRDKEEFARVEAAVDEMFDVAISLHGTLSGEHGIGTAKSKWMEKETSRGTILFSQRLRRALDPKGLLNPTKLVGI